MQTIPYIDNHYQTKTDNSGLNVIEQYTVSKQHWGGGWVGGGHS